MIMVLEISETAQNVKMIPQVKQRRNCYYPILHPRAILFYITGSTQEREPMIWGQESCYPRGH